MKYFIILLSTFFMLSCQKYLDKKTDIKLAIPTSLDDFQNLLYYSQVTENAVPQLGELGSDDYFVSKSTHQSLAVVPQNSYIWAQDIWRGQISTDWNNPYSNIYISNVVLEGLSEYKDKNTVDLQQWNMIYGHALFIRAFYHFYLEETFGRPYVVATANNDLGIPLKLSANLAGAAVRATTKEVLEQVVKDLTEATQLLPNVTVSKNKPSKAAAFAILARVFLTMQNYADAGRCADSSLKINNTLYDYSNVTNPSTNNNPFVFAAPPNDANFETLFTAFQVNYSIIRQSYTSIDSNLYNSYDVNDLRKVIFFRPNAATKTWYFKGNYSGSTTKQFGGPAVDEMYLTRAECLARAGKKDEAMDDVNTLLQMRFKKVGGVSTYVDQVATDADQALNIVLTERRKELIFRGVRWIDLRRLNQDPRFAKTITRNLDGQLYALAPNDPKYAYPIPESEIRLSGMAQNVR